MFFEIVICLIVFYLYRRFYPLINVMEELNAFLDYTDTPKVDNAKKRDYLKGLIAKGQQIAGKKSWTLEGIDSAFNKVINSLYAKNSAKHTVEKAAKHTVKKDVMSRISGVTSVDAMMRDINGNFLIKTQASQMVGKITPAISSHTPMEVLGSHVYEKCGMYLAPAAMICTIFNHLDWESFPEIAEQRKNDVITETINEDE